MFGGNGWEYDPATEEFYFHLFLKEQPDLNWRNPAVPRAILDVMRFWLNRGVDGFRLDVFNAYFKQANLPDNPPKFGLRGFDRQRHIYDISQPDMIPFLVQLRTLFDSYPERYVIGETFLEPPERAATYMGEQALHGAFNFNFLEQPWNPKGFLSSIQTWENAMGRGRWPNYVLNNHDNPRSTTRYRMADDDDQAKLAAMFLLTLQGTPFLYYGEEIGMRDIPLSRNEIMDPPGKKYWPIYTGRDGCRSPMQWSKETYGGFSTAKPWLPIHPNYHSRNVENQLDDPESLLSFYQRMLKFRKENPVLQHGGWKPQATISEKVLSYLRSDGTASLLIMLNFSAGPVKAALPNPETGWKIRLSNRAVESPITQGIIDLAANQGIILEPEAMDS